MTVEAATYITDLQPVNPPSTDPTAQGDDHIRLIKTVLQNTFPTASRALYAPATVAKSSNYTVLKADGESAIYASTTGGVVTFTLPSLVAGDAGWRIYFIKTTSDANPMFIKAASGNVNSGGIGSFAQARRCIPGVRISVIWDGTNWFVTRALAVPVGSLIDFWGSTLPSGYEWPAGGSLSSAVNYPEYNAVMGGISKPDVRGRVCIPLDNLGGSAAGNLGSIINGTGVGNAAGTETITLNTNQIPAHSHANTISVSDTGHAHSYTMPALSFGTGSSPSYFYSSTTTATTATGYASISASITNVNNVTTGTFHSNLPPSIMLGKILVVE